MLIVLLIQEKVILIILKIGKSLEEINYDKFDDTIGRIMLFRMVDN